MSKQLIHRVFVGALIYIDRVLLNFPKMRVSAANIHR